MRGRGAFLLEVHCEGLLSPVHDDDANVFRRGRRGGETVGRGAAGGAEGVEWGWGRRGAGGGATERGRSRPGLRPQTATQVDSDDPWGRRGGMVTDLPRPFPVPAPTSSPYLPRSPWSHQYPVPSPRPHLCHPSPLRLSTVLPVPFLLHPTNPPWYESLPSYLLFTPSPRGRDCSPNPPLQLTT